MNPVSHRIINDPIDREAERVINEQVGWWVTGDWVPADAARALNLPSPGSLSWADIKRKMRIRWLDLNAICISPTASRG